MKYIRSGDGRLYDVGYLKKMAPYWESFYKDLEVGEVRLRKGFGGLELACTGFDEILEERVDCSLSLNCESSEYVESDSLEDLFDAIVIAHRVFSVEEGKKVSVDDVAKWVGEGENALSIPSYGAIWTETGLQYVAERKEGEWEIIL